MKNRLKARRGKGSNKDFEQCKSGLLKMKMLSGRSWCVYHALIEAMRPDNSVDKNLDLIGKDLGVTKSTVSRSVRSLIDAGMVKWIIHAASGRKRIYVNPVYHWKESVDDRNKKVERMSKSGELRSGDFIVELPKHDSATEGDSGLPDSKRKGNRPASYERYLDSCEVG